MPRMGMRAAQHPALTNMPGSEEVGAKPGAARHLIHAVRTNRPACPPRRKRFAFSPFF